MSNPGSDALRQSINDLAEVWRVSNKYNAASMCGNCAGIVRHEPWCSTVNDLVSYAFTAAVDPLRLSPWDSLMLHAVGVIW